jgi:hypothetical protein
MWWGILSSDVGWSGRITKKLSMKLTKKYLWKACVSLVVALVVLPLLINLVDATILNSLVAQAASGPEAAFDSSTDPQDIAAIEKLVKSKSSGDAFNQSWVIVRGGIWGAGTRFNYTRNTAPNGLSIVEQYSTNYYCVNGTPQLADADSNEGNIKIEASVYTSLSDHYHADTTILAGSAVSHITFTPTQVAGTPTAPTIEKSYDGQGNPLHPGSGDGEIDVNGKNITQGCDIDVADISQAIPNLMSNATPQATKDDWAAAVTAGGDGSNGSAGTGSSPPGSGGSSSGTACAGGALGFFFCPLINYMTSGIQTVAGLISSMLTVKFLSSQSGGLEIETIWRAILSVANILLVVAFMFIVFSQSTSMGLSNYGIKKMLPRMVIAAILMNLSFYICALAIDFSNIIGASVMGFLLGSGHSISESIGNATGGPGGLLGTAGGIAAGAALIGVLLFLLTPVLLGILVVFVALVGRQVILLCLVLVSPLAFVAWLLPNTEKYFKKWSDMFIGLLVAYPMIMAIFGASLLLSNLLGAAGSGVSIGGP